MTGSPTHRVTELLRAWSEGDEHALDQLVPLVYGELRRTGETLHEPGGARSHTANHGVGE